MNKDINFHAVMEKNVDESGKCTVKGFSSLNNADRSQDYIAPEAFNLERFGANPQVLYNHKFWKDGSGNEMSIGRADTTTVATAVKSSDPTMWDIQDDLGNIINTLSKSAAPDVIEGSRGLWVEADIIIPQVVKQVKAGLLNTFSWKGMAHMAKARIGNIEKIITKAIDLHEVSLVYIPDNFAANFELAKSLEFGTDIDFTKDASFDELELVSLRFNDTLFTSEEAKEWVQSAGICQPDMVKSTEAYHVVEYENADHFKINSIRSIEVETGIQAFVGKKLDISELNSLEKNTESNPVLTNVVDNSKFTNEIDTESQRSGNMSKKTQEEIEQETVALEIEKSEETVDTVEAPEEIEKSEDSTETTDVEKNADEEVADEVNDETETAEADEEEVEETADEAGEDEAGEDDADEVAEEVAEEVAKDATDLEALADKIMERFEKSIADSLEQFEKRFTQAFEKQFNTVDEVTEQEQEVKEKAVDGEADTADAVETEKQVQSVALTAMDKKVLAKQTFEGDMGLGGLIKSLDEKVEKNNHLMETMTKSAVTTASRDESVTSTKEDTNIFAGVFPFMQQ